LNTYVHARYRRWRVLPHPPGLESPCILWISVCFWRGGRVHLCAQSVERCAYASTPRCTRLAAGVRVCSGRNGRSVVPSSWGSRSAGQRGFRVPPRFACGFNGRAAACVFAWYVSVACTRSRCPYGVFHHRVPLARRQIKSCLEVQTRWTL
jgi:hypothetical protein